MGIIWFLIKVIFFVFFAFSLLHAIVTHFVLLYEMRLQFLTDGYRHKISILALIKSFFVEFCCNFMRLLLLPFLNVSYNTIITKEVKTPILLIHGYVQNQTDWLWFRHKLKEKNVGPIYSLNLCPPFASITEFAELVKKKVELIRQETKHPNIILIGHSMGGLIASFYSEYLAPPHEVSAVITLGSPFQGTKLAALGMGQNAVEMAPNSKLLSDLTQKIEKSSVKYHYIASKIDNLIVPWDSAIPAFSKDRDNNKLILEDHGHLSLLISPKVINQVEGWVADLN